MSQRRVAVLQPSYLPWLGYLDQLDAADVFVFYDDVQFDPGGWRNRNRIKTSQGVRWLTVPVTHDRDAGAALPMLPNVRVADTPWRRKHLSTLRQAYARTPRVELVTEGLERVLDRGHASLVDLTVDTVEFCAALLGIQAETVRSSALGIDGSQSGRLLNICRALGATHYLSGAAARSYLDIGLFREAGIEVEFQDYQHPSYPQPHGEFVPYLSVIDLIANVDEHALDVLRSGRRYVPAGGPPD